LSINHFLLAASFSSFPFGCKEAETGGGYINAKEALPIRQAAIKMGHPQGPTPLQFDNKCAMGILTGVLKQ
jgi:hypothetical protein